MISVVVADDQDLVRAGFRVLVDSASDLEVVAEAGTGSEAVAATLSHHPDAGMLWAAIGVAIGAIVRHQIPAIVGSLLWLLPGGGIEDLLRN
ncbi:MAG: response regulator transcription factor, partial [Actinomycetota bacterium]